MIPPNIIKIISDGNILEYQNQLTPIGTKNKQFIYKYTKSKTKKGTLLGLNENELTQLIKTNPPCKEKEPSL